MIVRNLPPEEHQQFTSLIKARFDEELEDLSGITDWERAGIGDRFPRLVWLQHRARCEQVFKELVEMVSDGYAHQLSALQEYALHQSLEAWRIEAESLADHASEADRVPLHQEAEEFDKWVDLAFDNADFLHADEIAKSVLEGTSYAPMLGINPRDYLELMPDDIRVRVERALGQGP